ncbi:pleckstrin homology domain-containing family B member 1 [Thamnophis elegans]|uniref:pleckstrin homology domain-containing family B member 1 n=1 Tax=Thamnophis elegans TaxID=35005 RepID=UPI0013770BB1|nr:pleckstrin homology domain-containing family B member 1 [Thamnophis elegans]
MDVTCQKVTKGDNVTQGYGNRHKYMPVAKPSDSDHVTPGMLQRLLSVKSAHIQPPEGKTRECLMCIVQRDGPKTMLCAESEDDALAWKMAIMEAKGTQVHLYDPYDDYYQTVPLDSHQAMYVSSDYHGYSYVAPGTTHVIIREDPYRVSGDQMALGLLAGAATGAALGSFMWMPCWF